MKDEGLKRIAVIGLPGSGKSTFAGVLGEKLNLPVHHLDRHMFDGRRKIDHEEFLVVKEDLVAGEKWIIEGCSLKTLELRFLRADLVIYMQFSRLLCLWRLLKRVFVYDEKMDESGCLRGINWTLIKYMWNFDRDKREGIENLRVKYPTVKFLIFKKPQELDTFLEQIHSKD